MVGFPKWKMRWHTKRETHTSQSFLADDAPYLVPGQSLEKAAMHNIRIVCPSVAIFVINFTGGIRECSLLGVAKGLFRRHHPGRSNGNGSVCPGPAPFGFDALGWTTASVVCRWCCCDWRASCNSPMVDSFVWAGTLVWILSQCREVMACGEAGASVQSWEAVCRSGSADSFCRQALARRGDWLYMSRLCARVFGRIGWRVDRTSGTIKGSVERSLLPRAIFLIFTHYYRKRGSASYIVREWLLWVVERERETAVTSSISRWNREWSWIWLPRQRIDPMHMHTRRRVLSLQLLSSARSSWQAKTTNSNSCDRAVVQVKYRSTYPNNPGEWTASTEEISKKWIKLILKTIGNRKGDCAWSCSRWQTQPEKICKLQSTNQ